MLDAPLWEIMLMFCFEKGVIIKWNAMPPFVCFTIKKISNDSQLMSMLLILFFFSNKIAVQLAKAEEWEILGKDAVLGKFHCTNSSKEKLKRYENLFQPAK